MARSRGCASFGLFDEGAQAIEQLMVRGTRQI